MYTKPAITDLGSLAELTQAGRGKPNKIGSSPDIYSNVVPIDGSIVPQR